MTPRWRRSSPKAKRYLKNAQPCWDALGVEAGLVSPEAERLSAEAGGSGGYLTE
jgi:hypothetical protein